MSYKRLLLDRLIWTPCAKNNRTMDLQKGEQVVNWQHSLFVQKHGAF